jgi:hypothetical protein
MNNAVFWDVASCRYFLTDVSEERIASIFRVKEIAHECYNVSANRVEVTSFNNTVIAFLAVTVL